MITQSVNFVRAALEAASKEPSVKRFVLTSSAAAAASLKANEKYDLTPGNWNTTAFDEAWKPEPYTDDRIWFVYMAAKVQAELEMWKWVEEKKPSFVTKAVLPDFICGCPLSVKDQGYPSSMTAIKLLVEGNDGWIVPMPQHMIDVGDAPCCCTSSSRCPERAHPGECEA